MIEGMTVAELNNNLSHNFIAVSYTHLYTSFLRKGQAVETAVYAQIRNTVPSLYAVGGQLSLISVSYTHLDVYKRQCQA